MSEWSVYSLGQMGAIVTGKTPSKDNPEDWGTEMPFVTPSDYGTYGKKAYSASRRLSKIGEQRLHAKILPPNSIMVTCIGSDMGKVAMNAVPVITNQQINAIIPKCGSCDPDFLYYKLVSMYETLRAFGGDGTAVPIVNKGDFSNIKSDFPEPIEQKAIAEVLSSLDDKIDLLHRQNKTLESLAETLFRHWIIDGVQDDWKRTTIGQIVTIKGGTTPSTKAPEFWDGDICWTSPRDLSNQKSVYLFDTARKITPLGLAQIGSGLMPVGTVLMSSRAPIGYLTIADMPVAINQGYIAMVCDKSVSNHYIYLWCKANMEAIKNAGNGSTFEEISKGNFKAIECLLPPASLLSDFEIQAEALFQKIHDNSKQVLELERIRNTLLPKLISGDVRVEYEAAS